MKLVVISCLIAFAFAEECAVKTDFETTCKIGGLVLIKEEAKIKVSDENCDAIFKKEQFATPPNVTFPKAGTQVKKRHGITLMSNYFNIQFTAGVQVLRPKGQTYTLLAIDPDAPNHPKGTYYLHWIKANIPGQDLAKGDTTKGIDLIPYVGPGPPINTGLHRYMFIILRHVDPALRLKNNLTEQERRRFNLSEWITKVQNKEGAVCGPEAGIQFRSQYA